MKELKKGRESKSPASGTSANRSTYNQIDIEK
jgi:hypothetical protein